MIDYTCDAKGFHTVIEFFFGGGKDELFHT